MPFMKNGKRDYKKIIDEEGRTCQKCFEYKPWSEYSEKNASGRKPGKQPRCKKCAAEDTRAWVLKNKDTARERYLQNTYKISENEYNAMLLRQNNRCLLCTKEFDNTRWGADSPVVDHCHARGDVRGILCNECNRGLGYFHDNVDTFFNAIKYLRGEL